MKRLISKMSVIEKDWLYKLNISDIEERMFSNFEQNFKVIGKDVLDVLEENNLARKYDMTEQLKLLSESNKELKTKLEMKLNHVEELQTVYARYKNDYKILQDEIKDTYETFLTAKKYYKKFLKIYFSIENITKDSEVVFIQFFTEVKKVNDDYSVRFLREATGQYQLQSMKPKIKKFTQLEGKLLPADDVPGLLCYIRQEFINLKKSKEGN